LYSIFAVLSRGKRFGKQRSPASCPLEKRQKGQNLLSAQEASPRFVQENEKV
jgi:hypothetical protein